MISTVPVYGVLTRRPFFDFGFGETTSYEEIYENISQAIENPDVDEIVLDIDSCGGEVSGLFDLCDFIKEASKTKPITAYANDSCLSAAYAIASSCSKVLINRTSSIGSIGVIATHLDVSEADKKEGFKYTTIFKGARKNDLNPHETLSEEAKEQLSQELTRLYEMFVELVAQNRNLPIERVMSLEAGIFYGLDAVNAGLADELTNSFKLNSFKQTYFEKKENIMEIETTEVKAETVENTEEVEVVVPSPPAVPIPLEEVAVPIAAEAKSASYKSEIAEIARLCKLAKMPEKLAEFVETGLSVDDARDSLMKALASKTDDIRSTVSMASKPAESVVSPVIAAARARQNTQQRIRTTTL